MNNSADRKINKLMLVKGLASVYNPTYTLSGKYFYWSGDTIRSCVFRTKNY